MKTYIQHPSRVLEGGNNFKHVMAISLDPATDNREGVIRCITSRTGDVGVSGYVDRSELYTISSTDFPEHFKIGERLIIRKEKEVIEEVSTMQGIKSDFIGFEDPDIYRDPTTKLLHLYFTMPFLITKNGQKEAIVHLGHAAGKYIHSLEMAIPVLLAEIDDRGHPGAKELSIAPANVSGVRLNLVESSIEEDDFTYSTVRIAIAKDMGKDWKFGETVFHPKKHGIPWIGGHASPGPLFPREFIDIGPGRLVGIMNGREANKKVGKDTKYGIFSIGLFIYDYENGAIEWVSPEPLIRDTEAKTITFASQFIHTGNGEGILYAHVDDSFVRAYTLFADGIKSLLPK